MTAAEPTDLSLDPTLLMGTVNPGDTEEAVESVMGPQCDEPRVLFPFSAQRAPDHRGLEVVIPDHPGRHPTQTLEGLHVPIEEGLLGLVRVGNMDRFARVRQAQHEHPQLHHHPGDLRLELPEVDLGLSGRGMGLRDLDLQRLVPDLTAQLSHQRPNAGLGHLGAVLLEKALPHPPSGMALLARNILVSDQPPPHRGHMRAQHRGNPRRDLARRRRGISQRLTHRATVHLVLLRKGSDRHIFIPPISSDTFELLHSRQLLHMPHPFCECLGRHHER